MAELATLQWNRKNQKNNIRKSRNYINSNEENSRNFKNGSKFYTSRATDLEKENNESIKEAQAFTKNIIKRKWRRSGDFIVNFEHNSYLFLVFLSLTLNK